MKTVVQMIAARHVVETADSRTAHSAVGEGVAQADRILFGELIIDAWADIRAALR